MKSSFERFALLAGLLVLVASVQFACGIGGALLALPVAFALGLGATLLWFHFDLPANQPFLPPVLLAAAVLLSSTVLELGLRPDFAAWFAFVFAALGSGLAVWLTLRNRTRCNLCNRRLASQALTFRCPRCSQQVCEETCWNFEHRRCSLCLEQRVPILPIETNWWTRTTGPRATQGRCQVCLTPAADTDLRTCPKCRRQECRDCWDFGNGECGRCGAALPDLPAALGNIVATAGHTH